MDKEKVIFSKHFNRTEMYDDMPECNNFKPEFETGAEFLEFVKANTKLVVDRQRLSNLDLFFGTVKEFSDDYLISTELKEITGGYMASIYMEYASYNGYLLQMVRRLINLCDDFSFFPVDEKEKEDFLGMKMCFTYHTHHIYLKDREITDFS